jgi:hypothetical protein
MEIGLKPTFVENFNKNNGMYAVIDGRVYTIHDIDEPRADKHYKSILGRSMDIRESEMVWEKERNFFERNSEVIDNYIRNELNEKFLKGLNKSATEIDELKKALKDAERRKKDAPLDELAKAVFRAYFEQKVIVLDEKKKDIKIDAPDYTNLDVTRDSTIFSASILGRDAFFRGNNCLKLVQNESITPDGEQFRINGRAYEPVFIDNRKSFEKRYKDIVVDKIDSLVRTAFPEYKNQLELKGSELEVLKRNLALMNMSARNHGNMSFVSYPQGEHEFVRRVDPYLNNIDGVYYIFRGGETRMPIIVNNNRVSIPYKPTQPFQSFCWGHIQEKEHRSIGYNSTKNYSIDDPVLAGAIAGLFRLQELKMYYGWKNHYSYEHVGTKAQANALARKFNCTHRIFTPYLE